jgi:antitoxin component of MazEF toxin-antitoxin module
MKVNRVRRVGNSKVISLPPELSEMGFHDGAQVMIQGLPSGEVRLVPTSRLYSLVREYGRRVVAENREALDILAGHDQR